MSREKYTLFLKQTIVYLITRKEISPPHCSADEDDCAVRTPEQSRYNEL